MTMLYALNWCVNEMERRYKLMADLMSTSVVTMKKSKKCRLLRMTLIVARASLVYRGDR